MDADLMGATGGDRHLQAVASGRPLQQLHFAVGGQPFANPPIGMGLRPQTQPNNGCSRSTTSDATVSTCPGSNPGIRRAQA